MGFYVGIKYQASVDAPIIGSQKDQAPMKQTISKNAPADTFSESSHFCMSNIGKLYVSLPDTWTCRAIDFQDKKWPRFNIEFKSKNITMLIGDLNSDGGNCGVKGMAGYDTCKIIQKYNSSKFNLQTTNKPDLIVGAYFGRKIYQDSKCSEVLCPGIVIDYKERLEGKELSQKDLNDAISVLNSVQFIRP